MTRASGKSRQRNENQQRGITRSLRPHTRAKFSPHISARV